MLLVFFKPMLLADLDIVFVVVVVVVAAFLCWRLERAKYDEMDCSSLKDWQDRLFFSLLFVAIVVIIVVHVYGWFCWSSAVFLEITCWVMFREFYSSSSSAFGAVAFFVLFSLFFIIIIIIIIFFFFLFLFVYFLSFLMFGGVVFLMFFFGWGGGFFDWGSYLEHRFGGHKMARLFFKFVSEGQRFWENQKRLTTLMEIAPEH